MELSHSYCCVCLVSSVRSGGCGEEWRMWCEEWRCGVDCGACGVMGVELEARVYMWLAPARVTLARDGRSLFQIYNMLFKLNVFLFFCQCQS